MLFIRFTFSLMRPSLAQIKGYEANLIKLKIDLMKSSLRIAWLSSLLIYVDCFLQLVVCIKCFKDLADTQLYNKNELTAYQFTGNPLLFESIIQYNPLHIRAYTFIRIGITIPAYPIIRAAPRVLSEGHLSDLFWL